MQPVSIHTTLSYRTNFYALFIVILLSSLTASCGHRPWDIDRYIQNLERPERDEYQQPDKVVEALNLTPGLVVADIGAGSGYFTRRMVKAIGETGKIVAVDVEPKMLDYNKQELQKLGIVKRVDFILAKPESPGFLKDSVDLIFLCDVYHHLNNHIDYMSKLKPALIKTGRVVIIDFYHDERSGKLGFSKHHLVPKEEVIRDMEQAGYSLSKEHHFLPRQYFLEFVPNK